MDGLEVGRRTNRGGPLLSCRGDPPPLPRSSVRVGAAVARTVGNMADDGRDGIAARARRAWARLLGMENPTEPRSEDDDDGWPFTEWG